MLVTVSRLAIDFCKIHPLFFGLTRPYGVMISHTLIYVIKLQLLLRAYHTHIHGEVEFRSIRFIMHPFSC